MTSAADRFDRYMVERTPTCGEVRKWLDEHVADGSITQLEADQIEAQCKAGVDRTPWIARVNTDFLFGQWWSSRRTMADAEAWLARCQRCGWLDEAGADRLRARAMVAIAERER